LSLLGLDKSYDINVKVYGGGLSGQSDAILRIYFSFIFTFILLFLSVDVLF